MSAPNGLPLGYQGVLYTTASNRATWAATQTGGVYTAAPPASLVRIGAVRNVEEGWEREKVDGTTRDMGGFKGYAAGLLDVPLKFDCIVNNADAGQSALIAALLAGLSAIPDPTSGTLSFQMTGSNAYSLNTSIPLLMLDQPSTTSGAKGVWGDFVITKFAKKSEMKDFTVYDVEADPAISLIPPQLVVVT